MTDLFATWSELRAHCESLGSELVSIHSNEQNRSLTGAVLSHQGIKVGRCIVIVLVLPKKWASCQSSPFSVFFCLCWSGNSSEINFPAKKRNESLAAGDINETLAENWVKYSENCVGRCQAAGHLI